MSNHCSFPAILTPFRDRLAGSVLGLALTMVTACGGDPPADDLADAPVVLEAYADLLHAEYDDALTEADALDVALEAFLAAPSASTLASARAAWVESRPAYLQTEVARFYGGPIDDEETGPEGQLNAWPMDEAYVDYVVGPGPGFETMHVGIVNDPSILMTISPEGIAALNQSGAEENVATGYHAIEFLLWGQDTDAAGPGARSHEDYLSGGAAMNPERRAAYLRSISTLLREDLRSVRDAWAPGEANYRAEFVALPPREGVRRMLLGMGSLSGAELAGERLNVAYETKEQEDEHSCFSDTTTQDARYDAIGIRNVYLGRYTRSDGSVVSGASLSDLVRARDPDLDARMRAALDASVAAVEAIPAPFDQAILGSDDAPGRVALAAAIAALRAQTPIIVEIATLFDVTLNLEE